MERNTRQRAAILECIREADRPLGPTEILQLAKVRVPELGQATVYRTIKSLLAENLAVAVDLPGAPARYEAAGKAHHHHFLCKTCNRMLDMHGCPGNLSSLAPRGCTVEGHELTLYGTCADCRSGAKPRRRTSPSKR